MSGFKTPLVFNPWVIVLLCAIIAGVIGFVTHLLSQNWIPATALGYAVFYNIFANARTKRLKTEFNLEKINILKRVCTDKIGLARSMSNKQNRSALIYCLIELEFLVTEIGKCCDKGDDRDKFKKVKGLIGSTKTTFDKSVFDNSIEEPYGDVVECVSELESYLNDI